MDHQLQRTRDMKYVIEDTKTESGERMVPMTTGSEGMHFSGSSPTGRTQRLSQWWMGTAASLFLDKNGRPMVALHWEKYFQHIREKYNRIYQSTDAQSYSSCLQTHFLFQYGEVRNESENASIYYGS